MVVRRSEDELRSQGFGRDREVGKSWRLRRLGSREEDGKELLWEEGGGRERGRDLGREKVREEVMSMEGMESRIELPFERWMKRRGRARRKVQEEGKVRTKLTAPPTSLLPSLKPPLLFIIELVRRTYRFLFFTSSLTVLSLSPSLSWSQFVILERVPLLLTTMGPRASNLNTPPATPPSACSISI